MLLLAGFIDKAPLLTLILAICVFFYSPSWCLGIYIYVFIFKVYLLGAGEMVQMVIEAWRPEFYAWDLAFVRVFTAVIKHSDLKQPGEERVHFASRPHHCSSRKDAKVRTRTGQEPEDRS